MTRESPQSGSTELPTTSSGEKLRLLVRQADEIQQSVSALRRDLRHLVQELVAANLVNMVGEPLPKTGYSPNPVVTTNSPFEIDALEKEMLYCCRDPVLLWSGAPDAPSICCKKCGFVAMEYGELQGHPTELHNRQPLTFADPDKQSALNAAPPEDREMATPVPDVINHAAQNFPLL